MKIYNTIIDSKGLQIWDLSPLLACSWSIEVKVDSVWVDLESVVIFCEAESVFVSIKSAIFPVEDIVFVIAVVVVAAAAVCTVPLKWVVSLDLTDSLYPVETAVVSFLSWPAVLILVTPLLPDCKTTNDLLDICTVENVEDLP